jgi:hypothetical protein
MCQNIYNICADFIRQLENNNYVLMHGQVLLVESENKHSGATQGNPDGRWAI